MADVCSVVHLVCLFMITYVLALLQDNCLDLLCCAFSPKLSGCGRNVTAFFSTPTEVDEIGYFGRYRYIGKTQISVYL